MQHWCSRLRSGQGSASLHPCWQLRKAAKCEIEVSAEAKSRKEHGHAEKPSLYKPAATVRSFLGRQRCTSTRANHTAVLRVSPAFESRRSFEPVRSAVKVLQYVGVSRPLLFTSNDCYPLLPVRFWCVSSDGFPLHGLRKARSRPSWDVQGSRSDGRCCRPYAWDERIPIRFHVLANLSASEQAFLLYSGS